MMFGYATDETEEYMPVAIMLAHRLTKALADARRDGLLSWLRPDGKAQVTVAYDGMRPVAVETVVVSTQHDDNISTDKIRKAVIAEIIEPAIPKESRPITSIPPAGLLSEGPLVMPD